MHVHVHVHVPIVPSSPPLDVYGPCLSSVCLMSYIVHQEAHCSVSTCPGTCTCLAWPTCTCVLGQVKQVGQLCLAKLSFGFQHSFFSQAYAKCANGLFAHQHL